MTAAPDLLSLVLTLQPLASICAQDQKPPPLWWGRAAHALLLEVIRQEDDRLADSLHEPDTGPRPFTVSTLIGPATRQGLQAGNSYSLRLTAFREDVCRHLLSACQPGGSLSAGNLVELDYIGFQVISAIWQAEAHPWAGLASYQELSAPYLLAQLKPDRRVTLRFTSPTVFKSKGMHIPLPLPGLVFNSLLDRWNTCAPVVFPPEVRRYAEECLAVSRYRLHTRVIPIKSRGLRVGGLGEISYTSLNYDRYWMSVIHTLARFALFSGVGAGTTMGLGQARQQDGGLPLDDG